MKVYRVICKDEGEYWYATRKWFNRSGAFAFAKTINPSRDAMVITEIIKESK